MMEVQLVLFAGPGPGWIPVRARELTQIWEHCRAAGTVYNGCTNVELCRRYGNENIIHIMGDGWYKRRGIRRHNEVVGAA